MYKNILIIKMSSLGDVLHTLPFAAALRKLYPEARISWLVHPQFAGFVPDPPTIDEVIYFDKKKFNSLGMSGKLAYYREMKATLQAKHFDLVIDMQGLFKSAVLAAISGCSERIGYCEMREGSGFISRAIKGEHSKDHVIERYLDVARYLGAKIDGLEDVEFPMPNLDKERASLKQKLDALGVPAAPSYVVIVPGARWVTKEWPVERYAEVISMLNADGYPCVLAGGPDEVEKGKRIVELCNNSPLLFNMIANTSLRELAALIQDCCFYISADTGPLHFAAALKKPLVAMYGPTKADRTGPYGSKNSTILISPAKCAGCLKKKCNDWHCMHDISAESVYKIFREKVIENG